MSSLTLLRRSCVLSAWEGDLGDCQWCNASIRANRRTVFCSDKCRRVWQRNHIWRFARAYARRAAGYTCLTPGCDPPRNQLDVNHIEPLNGAGYGPSCAHHQDNLEVRCKPSHQAITTAQAAARAAARKISG